MVRLYVAIMESGSMRVHVGDEKDLAAGRDISQRLIHGIHRLLKVLPEWMVDDPHWEDLARKNDGYRIIHLKRRKPWQPTNTPTP